VGYYLAVLSSLPSLKHRFQCCSLLAAATLISIPLSANTTNQPFNTLSRKELPH